MTNHMKGIPTFLLTTHKGKGKNELNELNEVVSLVYFMSVVIRLGPETFKINHSFSIFELRWWK